ncbi:hypothetical protein MMC07_004065 [Pseudocyphellaria aurata]|nr:hypothetical protein [Pseudocyphellaria aurata]
MTNIPSEPFIRSNRRQKRERIPKKPVQSTGSTLVDSDNMPGTQREPFPNHGPNERPQIAPQPFPPGISKRVSRHQKREPLSNKPVQPTGSMLFDSGNMPGTQRGPFPSYCSNTRPEIAPEPFPPRNSKAVDPHQIREPLPNKPVQSTGSMDFDSVNMPGTQREPFPNYLSNERQQILPQPFPPGNSKDVERLRARRNGHSTHGRESSAANPYAARADEIGLSHHIPGYQHLGGLLTPPGWNEGEAPIDPRAAELLFQASRDEANFTLEMNLDDTRHLGPEEQAELDTKRDQEWDSRFKLDRVLYEERVHVYRHYKKRKQDTVDLVTPQPINPPATTTYALNVNPPVPFQSVPNGESTRINASYPTHNQPGERVFQAPSSDSIDLGFVDPKILEPSFESQPLAAMQRNVQYVQNEMQPMNNANHEYMTYKMQGAAPQITQQGFFQGFPAPFANQPVKPFQRSHDGNGPFTLDNHCATTTVPRPPQYGSSMREPFEGSSNSFQRQTEPSSLGPPNPLGYRTAVPGLVISFGQEQNQVAGRDRQSMMPRNGHAVRNDAKGKFDEAKGNKEGSPRTKRKAGRAPKEKVEKAKPWYNDDVLQANLPTSIISDEAIQAGKDWKVNEPKRQKATPPRRRRGEQPEFNAYEGIPVSEETAAVLIANGAPDRRTSRGSDFPLSEATAAALVASGVPDRRSSPGSAFSGATQISASTLAGDSSVANAASAYSSLYDNGQSNFDFFRNFTHMEDSLDDGQDEDAGRRAIRQRLSNPGKITQTTPRSK